MFGLIVFFLGCICGGIFLEVIGGFFLERGGGVGLGLVKIVDVCFVLCIGLCN